MITFEITVGLLNFGQVRNYLKKLKFLGHDIKWHESKGWIDRTFTITCDSWAKRKIDQMIEDYNRDYR